MKRLLLITATLLITLASFAQKTTVQRSTAKNRITQKSSAQGSSESEAILDRAYNLFKASDGIKLSFKLYVTDQNGEARRPELGTALIKGDKFKISSSTTDVWFNGKTQWVLIKNANEVNISNPTNEEIATISPLALLGMYKNGYTLKKPISKTINGRSSYVIELIPAKSNKEFVTVQVAIEKRSNTIVQVILKLKNGTTNKIDITNYVANYKFADSEFTFNKDAHKRLEIIDLR